jgi:hypothetical protein
LKRLARRQAPRACAVSREPLIRPWPSARPHAHPQPTPQRACGQGGRALAGVAGGVCSENDSSETHSVIGQPVTGSGGRGRAARLIIHCATVVGRLRQGLTLSQAASCSWGATLIPRDLPTHRIHHARSSTRRQRCRRRPHQAFASKNASVCANWKPYRQRWLVRVRTPGTTADAGRCSVATLPRHVTKQTPLAAVTRVRL